MASNIPTNQVRAVDPFSSYNSDTVNKLTRSVTHGEDGLATNKSCDIGLDATSNTKVVLTPGVVYKDDVWINITQNHIVDFTDSDHYYNFGTGFDESGWYYIVLQYVYAKQRPAPQAKILILKPSQRYVYSSTSDLIFLKAVHVSGSGPFYVDSVLSYDPENTANKRTFIKNYSGSEIFLPTFNQQKDPTRIIYVESEDAFYAGYSDRWDSIGGGSTVKINTSGFSKGSLVYTTNTGNLGLANSGLSKTTADGVVTKVSSDGKIQVAGKVTNVPVENGVSVAVGDLLYLSKNQAGSVVPQKTTPFHQFVGRCIGISDSTSVDILFVRGEPNGEAGLTEYCTYVSAILPSGGAWISSIGKYYQDVTITDINEKNVIPIVWDSTSGLQIEPEEIEFVDNDTMRIWMTTNMLSLNVFGIGPISVTATTQATKRITATLPSGSWNGAGPYYQDVDLSSLSSTEAVLLVRDTSTNKEIHPDDVQFMVNKVRIWMNVNTKNLEVIAVGPAATTDNLIGLTTILPSGASWVASGGFYYQDIDISSFGTTDIEIGFYDDDDSVIGIPKDVEFILPSTVRVWASDNTHQLKVTIIG